MNKRPHSVTVIGWLFLVAGIVGLAYHATDFKTRGQFQFELVWVLLVRLLAIISAVFVLRANNWARWLLVIWVAYHVILSGFHSMFEFMVHGLLFGVVVYFLFRSPASEYFRSARAESAQSNKDSGTR